jgi:hypothetical protein
MSYEPHVLLEGFGQVACGLHKCLIGIGLESKFGEALLGMLLGLYHPTSEWTVIIALLQGKKGLRPRMAPACIIIFRVN